MASQDSAGRGPREAPRVPWSGARIAVKTVNLVKPPERATLNFGYLSLTALDSYIDDVACVRIIDTTELDIDDAVQRSTMNYPDIIGVTTMSLQSVHPASEYVSSLRASGYQGLIVVGGHGASMTPRPLLDAGANFVVYGEGEATLREIVTSGAEEDTLGLIRLKNGVISRTPPRPLLNLDKINEFTQVQAGLDHGGVALLETSRGCPHECRFCETTRFHRGVWRGRSPENVVKDIINLVVRHGASVIHIVDDNFTASPDRVLEICDGLEGGPMPLFFIFSARSDDLVSTRDLVPRMAKARFLRANIGVETLDPELSKSMGKRISSKQHREAFKTMRASEVFSVASFIVGLPGDSDEIYGRNLEFAVEYVDVAQFIPFLPLPGIPLGDGSGVQDERHVELSLKLKGEFDKHPKVLDRLLSVAEQPNVRGLLARETLYKRLAENALGSREANYVRERLNALRARVC